MHAIQPPKSALHSLPVRGGLYNWPLRDRCIPYNDGMKLCRSCSRYIYKDAITCPFCPPRSAQKATLLALSLTASMAVSCSNPIDDPPDSTATDSTTATTTTTTTTVASTTTFDDSGVSQGVAAYGGPPDSSSSTDASAGSESDTSSSSSSGTSSTGSSSTGSSSTGTTGDNFCAGLDQKSCETTQDCMPLFAKEVDAINHCTLPLEFQGCITESLCGDAITYACPIDVDPITTYEFFDTCIPDDFVECEPPLLEGDCK